ncbi:integrase [Bacteroidia bacterium]|nr:integrase [Bacteroidia bacterium]
MLSMKERDYINNLSEFEGLSLRAIAEKTGHHFETVKKCVDNEDWNQQRKPRKQRASGLDVLKPVIDDWLKEDFKRGRKYRRTATKIYKDLSEHKEHGKLLSVGKQTVINYVVKRKEELRHNTYKTAMYGLHAPGWAQVDFGDILVAQGNGAEVTWHELIVSFPWSNAGFAQVCRYETRECLCEALQNIFEYLGGVPNRILFDNMSSAVIEVLENGERKLTDMFIRFNLHYRFKADFCNPDSPNEKGNVENKVGYIRRNYLLPPPAITDLEAFNRQLLDKCSGDLERAHYEKGELISELFKEDKAAMLPIPAERYRIFTLEKVKTDRYSFIRFENNRYSTAPEYMEREMWLEAGTTELRILNEKYEVVATHRRLTERVSEPMIDFGGYIEALGHKPRAFMRSPYFLQLPEAVQGFLTACDHAKLKRMLKVLIPIIKDGKIDDAAAVLELTEIHDSEDFMTAYRALSEDPRTPPKVTTAATPEQSEYTPDFKAYAALNGK